MENKRSPGITFLGSLNTMLFGVFMLMVGLFYWFLLAIGSPGLVNRVNSLGYSHSLALFAYIQLVIISVCYIITGQVILNLKEWGRKWTTYLAIISLMINAILLTIAILNPGNNLITTSDDSIKMNINPFHIIGGVIYPIILIIFFTRPKVKDQFK